MLYSLRSKINDRKVLQSDGKGIDSPSGGRLQFKLSLTSVIILNKTVQVIMSNAAAAAAGSIKRSGVARGESKTSQRQIIQKHPGLLAFQRG